MRSQTSDDIKRGFSQRLNEICDDAGIPPKGQNRQTEVGRIFDVSQKAARKWLEGLGLPALARIAEIASHFDVQAEWLLTGRGDKKLFSSLSRKHRLLIAAYDKADPNTRQAVDLILSIPRM